MSLKNTTDHYGSIAKWFHWGTALLFLCAYISVYYRHWFTEVKTPENITALYLHLSFGITIGVVVVLRIIWRLMNKQPTLEPGSKLQHLAAHGGHYLLYFIMIITPLTGYMGGGGATNYFFLFEIPKFADTQLYTLLVTDSLGITFEEFEVPVDFIHKEILGKWLIWMLILGHVAAALYHHYVIRDKTLQRMTILKK